MSSPRGNRWTADVEDLDPEDRLEGVERWRSLGSTAGGTRASLGCCREAVAAFRRPDAVGVMISSGASLATTTPG